MGTNLAHDNVHLRLALGQQAAVAARVVALEQRGASSHLIKDQEAEPRRDQHREHLG